MMTYHISMLWMIWKTDGHLGLPAAAVLGNTVACGSGTHKRDQLCRQIADVD